jgi:uncharacterized membrane protein YphA (DoxX/SURF4 family)
MKRTFLEIICGLLILLWGYAAFSKLFIYDAFRFQLLGHKLLMHHAALVAWLVPAVEIGIALLLIMPRTRLAGLYVSMGMLAVFTAYIAYMFMFYPHKPCSCGGIISKLSWKQHIAFNVGFMVLAWVGVWKWQRSPPSGEGLRGLRGDPAGMT